MDQFRLDRLLGRLHEQEGETSVLRRICSVTCDVTSMPGAGVSRMMSGRHDALGAAGALGERMERLQVELAEGPCRIAVMSLEPCHAPDMTSSESHRRWPRFAPAALEQGVRAAFAFPLMSGRTAIGALDVYASEPGDLGGEQIADARVMASLAALAVERGSDASVTGVDLAAEPAEGWAHPAVVHHATGIVSEQLDIDVDQALLRLRAAAFAMGGRLADVAGEVVSGQLRIERWLDDA